MPDPPIGSISVEVTADLTQYNAQLAEAKAKAVQTDAEITGALNKSASATANLTDKQRALVASLINANATAKEAAQVFGKSAESQQLMAAFSEALAASQKGVASSVGLATQAVGQNAQAMRTAAQATNEATGAAYAASKAFADQLKAAKATFDLRASLTAQKFGDETKAAQAAAKAEEAIAASTFAFRQRLAKQQGAELARDAAAQTAAQKAEAASLDALRAKLDPLLTARSKLNAATKEADGFLAKGAITQAEHAAAVTIAEKAYMAEAKAIEHAAGTAINSRAAYEGLVLVHEALSGRFSRMASSAMIEAQQLAGAGKTAQFVTALMSPLSLAIGAASVTFLGAAAATYAYDEALRKLNVTASGVGAIGGHTGAQLESAAQSATGQTTIDIGAARSGAAAFAAAGVRDAETLKTLIALSSDYAQLTGQKLPDAQKALARAMEDPRKGAAALNSELDFMTASQERQIRVMVESGDKIGAQSELTRLLAQRTHEAADASGGLHSGLSQIGTAAVNALKNFAPFLAALERFDQLGGGSASAAAAQQKARIDAAQQRIQTRAQLVQQSQLGEQAADTTPEGREQLNFEDLKARASQLQQGAAASAKLGDTAAAQRQTAAYNAVRDAIGRVTDAHGKYITQADREHQIVQLQVQEAEATKKHDAALKGKLATQIELLKVGDKIETNAQAQRAAQDAGALASARVRTPRGPKDTYQDTLDKAKEAAAGELQLADAYLKSGGAALQAEAQMKALTEAVGKNWSQTRIAALAQSELNAEVAKAAAETAKKAVELEAETASRSRLDDAVAKGTLTRKEADRQIAEETAMRPLEIALTQASGAAKAELAKVLERLRAAQAAANAEADRSLAIDSTAKDREEIDRLKQKIALLNAPKSVQTVETAKLQRAQALGPAGAATPEGQASIASAGAVGSVQAQLAADEWIKRETADLAKQTETTLASVTAKKLQTEAQMGAKLATELLNKAVEQGIDLTPAQIKAIQDTAAAYAKLSKAAEDYQTRQKSLQDTNKQVVDSVEGEIEGLIDGTKTWKQALTDTVKMIDKDVLKATLSGEGPMAGLFGTAPGQKGQGGLLGQGINAIERRIPGLPTGGPSSAMDRLTTSADNAARALNQLAGTGAPGYGASGPGGILGGSSAPFGGSTGDYSSFVPANDTPPGIVDFTSQIGPLSNSIPTLENGVAGMTPNTLMSSLPDVPSIGGGGLTGILGGLGGAGGGGIGGILGGLAGSLLPGLFGGSSNGAIGGKPDGTQGNPFWVQSAGGGAGGGMGGLGSLFGGGGGGLGGMFSSLFGGGGAAGASIPMDLVGLMHNGGAVDGGGLRPRAIPHDMLLRAPRLHSGLEPDEFPAILQHGERVIRKGGKSHEGRGVTVHNHFHGVHDTGGFNRSSRQIARETKRRMGG